MIPAGAHGGDGARLAAALGVEAADVLDLSASLNPVAPSVAALVARHLDTLRRYPDPAAATRTLADAMAVDPSRLLLTNGGSEAIALVGGDIGGYVVEPEFALHPRGTSGALWRSDPHNPTGLLAGPGDRADVWDEAFYALATGRWTAPGRPVVVSSLTKLFACPGLRLGYVVADDVERFARRQPEWSVGSLALAVLADLVEHADVEGWAKSVADLRSDLAGVLRRAGLSPRASDANWLLVDAPGLRDRLMPRGVLVRDCTSFGMPGTVRIAVPDERGLERLEEVLCAVA